MPWWHSPSLSRPDLAHLRSRGAPIRTSRFISSCPSRPAARLIWSFDGTLVIIPHIFAKLPFDSINDFAPIGKIGDVPLLVLANQSVPAKSLAELIALSKTRAGSSPTARRERAVVDRLDAIGSIAAPGSAEQFTAQIKRDLARYGQVVKAAGTKQE